MNVTRTLSALGKTILAGAAALILGCGGNNKPSRSVDYTTTMPLYGNPAVDAIGLQRIIPQEDLENATGEIQVHQRKPNLIRIELYVKNEDPSRNSWRLSTFDANPAFDASRPLSPFGDTEKVELRRISGHLRERYGEKTNGIEGELTREYSDVFTPKGSKQDTTLARVGQSLHDYGRLRAMMHTNWRPYSWETK